MSAVCVAGWGAVSPAGWGMPALRSAQAAGTALAASAVARPGRDQPLPVRRVPPPPLRPTFLSDPRLRRTSPITTYALAAALEALGDEARAVMQGGLRLGVILCAMTGCVNYSRRFYDEVLRDPAVASPLLFPETVFNAPASHLAALLQTRAINYTLVGDPGSFAEGLALAAQWLGEQRVDGCLIVGAEEMDWLVAEALDLFDPGAVAGEGAGALYLKHAEAAPPAVRLEAVSAPAIYSRATTRAQAVARTRRAFPRGDAHTLLCDGRTGCPSTDRAEAAAWDDWQGPRLSPKQWLGEAFSAGSAWQCVCAVDWLQRGEGRAAVVSIPGINEQAVAVRFSARRPG